jgi:hypothetical protein
MKKNIGAQKCVTQRVANSARLVWARVSGSKGIFVKKSCVWSSAIHTMMTPRNMSIEESRASEVASGVALSAGDLNVAVSCIRSHLIEGLLTGIQMPSGVKPSSITAHEDLSGASRAYTALAVDLGLCGP